MRNKKDDSTVVHFVTSREVRGDWGEKGRRVIIIIRRSCIQGTIIFPSILWECAR
jgi:hypothetical protein